MIDFKTLGEALNPNTGRATIKDIARELEAINNPTQPAYTIPAKLLSKGTTNAKTSKNSLETFILYMSPADQNSKGADLCPFRSKGCTSACLYTAGRGKFNNVQRARMNKSEYFIRDKKTFLSQLALELKAINKRQLKKGTKAAIRLNGTTDVDFLYLLKNRVGLDALQLEGLVFYDYTKDPHRVKRYAGTNYTLTFSRAEDNEPQALEILENSGIVSAVFAEKLPQFYKGFEVFDGDKADDIMIKASKAVKVLKRTRKGQGLILGLKAKGDAKKDTSGFVITSHLNTGANV
jgi:hypothetical protein